MQLRNRQVPAACLFLLPFRRNVALNFPAGGAAPVPAVRHRLLLSSQCDSCLLRPFGKGGGLSSGPEKKQLLRRKNGAFRCVKTASTLGKTKVLTVFSKVLTVFPKVLTVKRGDSSECGGGAAVPAGPAFQRRDGAETCGGADLLFPASRFRMKKGSGCVAGNVLPASGVFQRESNMNK